MSVDSAAPLRRLSPSAIGLAERSRPFVVSDALLQAVATTVSFTDDTAGMPDLGSRNGSIFESVGQQRLWYLLELCLVPAPDAWFGFTATQQGADGDGDPFNIATVTFGLTMREPADVVAYRAQHPDAALDPIDVTSMTATLVLSYKNADGTTATRQVDAVLGVDGAVTFTVTLLGPDVLLAFSALTETGDVELRLECTYGVALFQPSRPSRPRDWRGRSPVSDLFRRPDLVIPTGPVPPDGPDPVSPRIADATIADEAVADTLITAAAVTDTAVPDTGIADTVTAARVPTFDLAARSRDISFAVPAGLEARPFAATRQVNVNGRGRVLTDDFVPLDVAGVTPATAGVVIDVAAAPPSDGVYVRTVTTDTVSLRVGDSYGSVSYRPRYLLETRGEKRVIATTEDLSEFDHHQSEFVELTALGQISDRFPSFRALYLGKVSGTVIAIPARYGIARTSDGVAAACDAVLDPSPASSGCRFHLTFALSPSVAVADLAGLTQELSQHPELSRLVTRVTVPARLAPANAVGLSNGSISGLSAGNGEDSGSFIVAFDVVDGAVPAIAAANLILKQLSARPVPTLVGSLSFALDDAFPTPVMSTTVLALTTTVGGDDVVIVNGDAGAYRLSNTGPVPVRVTSITAQEKDAGPVVTPVDIVIGSDSAAAGPAVTGRVLGIEASLIEPEGGFDAALARYLRMTVTDVQQIRMTVGVNAAGALAGSITRLDVTAVMKGMPGVALPTMTLTPATSIQQVVWQVPLSGGLLGLPADVTVHITASDGSERNVTLSHDFAEAPILALGVEDLTG